MATEVDKKKLRSLAFKVWSYKQGEMVALMIHLGDRLGLYKALAESGITCVDALARQTGYHPRWLLEWLRGQAAAKLLDYHHPDQFELTVEGAALLADDFGERRIEQILVNKKIRAASFRNQVLDAYDSTCAVTGLRIINGGGKAEAQAAHIWSVADGGPDVVPNGVALSATAHWLFDRHLITFDDNLCLLVSHNKVPSDLLKLFPPSGQKIRLPVDPRDHPRPDFVAKHRARFAGF